MVMSVPGPKRPDSVFCSALSSCDDSIFDAGYYIAVEDVGDVAIVINVDVDNGAVGNAAGLSKTCQT